MRVGLLLAALLVQGLLRGLRLGRDAAEGQVDRLQPRGDIPVRTAQEVPFYQGGVLLEGARYPVVVILQPPNPDDLYVGMPVSARFLPAEERTGRPRDFYFVPD